MLFLRRFFHIRLRSIVKFLLEHDNVSKNATLLDHGQFLYRRKIVRRHLVKVQTA